MKTRPEPGITYTYKGLPVQLQSSTFADRYTFSSPKGIIILTKAQLRLLR